MKRLEWVKKVVKGVEKVVTLEVDKKIGRETGCEKEGSLKSCKGRRVG